MGTRCGDPDAGGERKVLEETPFGTHVLSGKGLFLGAVGCALGRGAASAHFLIPDSVNDDSGEIRWVEYTRYDDARTFGIGQWNRLGGVPILRDSAATPMDLVFRDYSDCGTGTVGYWEPKDGPDAVNFNVCYMRKLSVLSQRASATHEIGHALRLAHPSGTQRSETWRKRSIMYYCSSCVPFNAPQDHDKADYHAIW